MSMLRFLFVIFHLVGFSCLKAQAGSTNWTNGAVAAYSTAGEPELEIVGDTSAEVKLTEALTYLPGTIRITSVGRASTLMRTSNDLSILVNGPGYFAIERFEQTVLADESIQSRMIINLREGLLVVDNRQLPESSKFVIETPVGRLSSKAALWFMSLEYDERSRIFNFSIECSDGVTRFTDNQGQTYVLRIGQRIAGAGSSKNPAVEVGETGERGRDVFASFAEAVSTTVFTEFSSDKLKAQTKPLNFDTIGLIDAEQAIAAASDGVRPVLIEYSPSAVPVTAYQGITRKPRFSAVVEDTE